MAKKATRSKLVTLSFADAGPGTCRQLTGRDRDMYDCIVQCIEDHTEFGAEQGRLIVVFEPKRKRGRTARPKR
jgi:hypothetical protein